MSTDILGADRIRNYPPIQRGNADIWDAKETPSGAQAKADAAETAAKSYTDAEVDAAIKAGAVNPRGDWSAAVAYAEHDLVFHASQSWYAKEATVAGDEPGVSAKWNGYAAGLDEATANKAYGDEESLLRHWTSGAIDSALTAALATGKPVFIPAGSYDLTATFAPVSGKIRGVKGKTIINTDGRTAFKADDVDLELQDLVIDLSADTAVDDGTPTTTQIGVDIRAATSAGCSLTCKGVKVRNAHGNGIRVSSPTASWRCEFRCTESVFDGVYFGAYVLRPTLVRFTDNEVKSCEYGFMAIGDIVAPFDNDTVVSDNTIHDCVAQGIIANQGLRNFAITGNTVTDCGVSHSIGWGIVVSEASARFAISGNAVTGCGGGITVDPRKSTGDVVEHVNGTVNGNSCSNSTRVTSGHGINVNYANGLTVAGNTCRGNAGHGIAVTGKRCHIGGNVSVDNTRSGLTLNLPAATTMGQHTVGVNVLADNGEANFVNTTTDSNLTLYGNKVTINSPVTMLSTLDLQTTGGGSRVRLSRMDTALAVGDVLGSLDFFSNDASAPAATVTARIEGRQAETSPNVSDIAFMVHDVTNLVDAMRLTRNRVMFLANAQTVPAANPTAGVYIYAEGGALKCRGSAGTVTIIAPA